MINRATKLRWRRVFRRGRRQVEDLSVQAEEQLEQHLIKRMSRLASVRRFMIGWIALIVLLTSGVIYQTTTLSRYYETLKPVPGGIFTEGIVGPFTNANPLYATGPVDAAVSRLVFGSLLKYDQSGKLVGDLAVRWSVDDSGTTYKVVLRPDLTWHDGQALTPEDVAFTYQTIQNPDAKSPLLSSWQGVKIEVRDKRTILFKLPNVLASFPYALTNGIVPKHILKDTPPAQLRSIPFDTVRPVGSGPFKWDAIEVTGDTPETRQETIALAPNSQYYAGEPKLQQYKIRTFLNEKSMLESFQKKELTAMSGLDTVPDELADDTAVRDYSIQYMGQVGVFLRTTAPTLGDAKVRQALVSAINPPEVTKSLGYPVVVTRSPLMDFHIGYSKDIQQLPFDTKKAKELLDAAGWKVGKNNIRAKDGKELSLQLYSQSTGEYAAITQRLQQLWREVGVRVDVMLQSDSELQKTISQRNYDMLLYGLSLGPDPDVFAFWHSSQASVLSSNRLNFADYKSSTADKALEAGRTRIDPVLRAAKYKPFLEAWRADAPAVMLYEPRYLYVANTTIGGFGPKLLSVSSDRYSNVHEWTIRQAKTAQ